MEGQGQHAVELEPPDGDVIYSESQPGSISVPRQQRYEQVADDLTKKIRSGEYPPGSRLPSRAQLGETYSVSASVIEKAMMLLRRDGLTETLAGVGVFVADPPAP
jgi:GntR family transcriptional regulator